MPRVFAVDVGGVSYVMDYTSIADYELRPDPARSQVVITQANATAQQQVQIAGMITALGGSSEPGGTDVTGRRRRRRVAWAVATASAAGAAWLAFF